MYRSLYASPDASSSAAENASNTARSCCSEREGSCEQNQVLRYPRQCSSSPRVRPSCAHRAPYAATALPRKQAAQTTCGAPSGQPGRPRPRSAPHCTARAGRPTRGRARAGRPPRRERTPGAQRGRRTRQPRHPQDPTRALSPGRHRPGRTSGAGAQTRLRDLPRRSARTRRPQRATAVPPRAQPPRAPPANASSISARAAQLRAHPAHRYNVFGPRTPSGYHGAEHGLPNICPPSRTHTYRHADPNNTRKRAYEPLSSPRTG